MPSEPSPIGVCSGVLTLMIMFVNLVKGSPVGEARVAVLRPVEPRACPGTHMSPQPVGPSSNMKPAGAMISNSRTTADRGSTSNLTSMTACGGLRTTVTVSRKSSTGLKPVASPSLVLVNPGKLSIVSKRHVLTPLVCGYTRIEIVYGVSARSATSVAGLFAFKVATMAPDVSSRRGTASICPVPMTTKPSVLSVYPCESPAPWELTTSLPWEYTGWEKDTRNSAVAHSPTRGWKSDFTG
mmetsp:Transcript_50259/g.146045  ORF Transcript_50259/g.146045 Transcript_50259/m.146045 type:complete len:240 (+) Transcript_50259:1035-1754(+)